MGRKDKGSDAHWRASYAGGPLDGDVRNVRNVEGSTPYEYLVPIPSDDPAFAGKHVYIVTEVDIENRVVEFTYTGERWDMNAAP